MNELNPENLENRIADKFDELASINLEQLATEFNCNNTSAYCPPCTTIIRERISIAGKKKLQDKIQFQPRKTASVANIRVQPASIGQSVLDSMVVLLKAGDETRLKISKIAKTGITYKSGDIASAGTLTCIKCGLATFFSNSGLIQPCRTCHNNSFSMDF